MMIYINYIFTIIGIGMIIISLFLIITEKIKGENIYYDLYAKEQDIRKAIDEANELISELIYTSETVVNEIEDHINNGANIKKVKENDNDIVVENKEKEVPAANNINIEVEIPKENKDIIEANRKTRIESILNMYNDKMSVDEIAKRLQMGKGEVALILSLNRGINSNEII